MLRKIGGRCPVCGKRDRRFFRKTAIKRSTRNLVARGGQYN